MVSEIPQRSRSIVKFRDQGRCARCASFTENLHWHHRRSRSIRDTLVHSPCNGVSLCKTCHDWVHTHPFEARLSGFIVSRYKDPSAVPIEHALFGRVRLNTDGTWDSLPSIGGGMQQGTQE